VDRVDFLGQGRTAALADPFTISGFIPAYLFFVHLVLFSAIVWLLRRLFPYFFLFPFSPHPPSWPCRFDRLVERKSPRTLFSYLRSDPFSTLSRFSKRTEIVHLLRPREPFVLRFGFGGSMNPHLTDPYSSSSRSQENRDLSLVRVFRRWLPFPPDQ